ncbi:DUF6610 family protein [uncultured Litoreibacter sp.]|uniref:DUF6610 family protein n=1 Tax=uncultured Litoreibacter sp. TaxID=1392394 RepID=UPI002638C6FB|nr:DUF6610 family protein [uncultured Litoreibacter sp.]
MEKVVRYVCHSKRVLKIAHEYGWKNGARYTNTRDIRDFDYCGFLDIDWKNYNFEKHLEISKELKPQLTIARDVDNIEELSETLSQAEKLLQHSEAVAIVPKDLKLVDRIDELIPVEFRLAFSVPTKYGGTEIPLESFGDRHVHLLGGRPDVQAKLSRTLNVVSIDTNRFTLDASFGDHFDGETFRPHPIGGYETCLRSSLENMNKLWTS